MPQAEEKKVKITDQRELELYCLREIMGTQRGRSAMYRLLEASMTFNDTFNDNPQIHAWNAGRRSNGLWLEDELKEASKDRYLEMLKENLDG